jgi:hypothetical protein
VTPIRRAKPVDCCFYGLRKFAKHSDVAFASPLGGSFAFCGCSCRYAKRRGPYSTPAAGALPQSLEEMRHSQ